MNQQKRVYVTVSFIARNHAKVDPTIKAVRAENPGTRLFVMTELNEQRVSRLRRRYRHA